MGSATTTWTTTGPGHDGARNHGRLGDVTLAEATTVAATAVVAIVVDSMKDSWDMTVSSEELVAWLDGRAEPDVAAAIEHRIDDDTDLQARVDRIRRSDRVLAAWEDPQPSPEAVQRVVVTALADARDLLDAQAGVDVRRPGGSPAPGVDPSSDRDNSRPGRSRRRRLGWVAAAGLAAVVVVAGVLVLEPGGADQAEVANDADQPVAARQSEAAADADDGPGGEAEALQGSKPAQAEQGRDEAGVIEGGQETPGATAVALDLAAWLQAVDRSTLPDRATADGAGPDGAAEDDFDSGQEVLILVAEVAPPPSLPPGTQRSLSPEEREVVAGLAATADRATVARELAADVAACLARPDVGIDTPVVVVVAPRSGPDQTGKVVVVMDVEQVAVRELGPCAGDGP